MHTSPVMLCSEVEVKTHRVFRLVHQRTIKSAQGVAAQAFFGNCANLLSPSFRRFGKSALSRCEENLKWIDPAYVGCDWQYSYGTSCAIVCIIANDKDRPAFVDFSADRWTQVRVVDFITPHP